MRQGYVTISGPIGARASALVALRGRESMDDSRVEPGEEDQHVSFIIDADDFAIAEGMAQLDAVTAINGHLRSLMNPAEFARIAVVNYFDRSRYREMFVGQAERYVDLEDFIVASRREYHSVGDPDDDDPPEEEDHDDDDDNDDEGDHVHLEHGGSSSRIVYDEDDPLS